MAMYNTNFSLAKPLSGKVTACRGGGLVLLVAWRNVYTRAQFWDSSRITETIHSALRRYRAVRDQFDWHEASALSVDCWSPVHSLAQPLPAKPTLYASCCELVVAPKARSRFMWWKTQRAFSVGSRVGGEVMA